ncbi:MAG TPA: hypothetical protein VM093_02320, partial [Aeromicrobium sp.]|nr:hypothetical protein [Aeromicrobium sp.]
MSTAGCMHVQCPECDVLVPIDLILKPANHEGEELIVGVEMDLTEAILHSWVHDPSLDDLQTLIQPETDIGGISPPCDPLG